MWVVREGFLEEVSWVLKDRTDNERILWVWSVSGTEHRGVKNGTVCVRN